MKFMNFLKLTTFIIFTLLLSNCKKSSSDNTATEPIPNRVTYTNKAYGIINAAQKMDIYLPAARLPYPVVVMIHGGGWVIGDKQEYSTSIKTEALLSRGYAVVAVNYRLSSVSKFPTQIQDVKAAIRYIRANASTYNLNP